MDVPCDAHTHTHIFFQSMKGSMKEAEREVDMGKRMGVMKERERRRRWACSAVARDRLM